MIGYTKLGKELGESDLFQNYIYSWRIIVNCMSDIEIDNDNDSGIQNEQRVRGLKMLPIQVLNFFLIHKREMEDWHWQ